MNLNRPQRYLLLGGIIGDYVGRPFEVHNINHTDFPLFSEHCDFTDDTILTMATAAALIGERDYGQAYFEWASRYPHHGYGPRFQQWVGAGPDAKPYWSCGNGSAMRVPPVAWAFDTLSEVAIEAKRSAEVTHNHPEGIQGAQALAVGIFMARKGASNQKIRAQVQEDPGLPLRFDLEYWRGKHYRGAVCSRTVPVSFAAFFEATNFEECIRLAISAGGDSDTIASMAGALAEARWGVPDEIALHVHKELPEAFQAVLAGFWERFGGGPIKR